MRNYYFSFADEYIPNQELHLPCQEYYIFRIFCTRSAMGFFKQFYGCEVVFHNCFCQERSWSWSSHFFQNWLEHPKITFFHYFYSNWNSLISLFCCFSLVYINHWKTLILYFLLVSYKWNSISRFLLVLTFFILTIGTP